MYKKIVLKIIILSVVIMVYGCSRAPLIVLYNNSDNEAIVYSYDQKKNVSKNSSIEIEFPSIKKKIKLQINGEEYVYKTVSPPGEFYEPGAFRDKLYYQINKNLNIYILKPGAKFPVKDLPLQPINYPLMPKKLQ